VVFVADLPGPTDRRPERRVASLLVSALQFRSYIERHAHLAGDDLELVPEDSAATTGSYIVIDPMGRFLDNVEGRLVHGKPILEVGVARAFALVRWKREQMAALGGPSAWQPR
jgi:radical S-adenosyl methionine domain-containing protein 2